MPIIECANVQKAYGEGPGAVRALAGIDLSVDAGEFVAIVGSSGSGKSTLLHLMGGLDAPTSGTVRIDGEDISQLDAKQSAIFRRRKAGIIYQFFNLIPTATVRDNILMPLLLDKRGPNQMLFDQIVDAVGLSNRLDAMPSELSGGQQQRVAIARALVYRPAIVLADEPTGNLDRATSREIVDLLKLANRQFNQTTLVVTHDEKVALEADRIITIEDGRIVADEKCR